MTDQTIDPASMMPEETQESAQTQPIPSTETGNEPAGREKGGLHQPKEATQSETPDSQESEPAESLGSTPEEVKENLNEVVKKSLDDLQSLREKEGTARQVSSTSEEEKKSISPETILMPIKIDEAILQAYPEIKEQGGKVGEMVTMSISPIAALRISLQRVGRLERLVELLYHVKSSQITTPESVKYKNELDRMVLHKTL